MKHSLLCSDPQLIQSNALIYHKGLPVLEMKPMVLIVLLLAVVACDQAGKQAQDKTTTTLTASAEVMEKDRPANLTLHGQQREQPADTASQPVNKTEPEANLAEVVAKYRNEIMSIPTVAGIGVGYCQSNSAEKCILVYTTTNRWPPALPRKLDGYSVEMKTIRGGFYPLQTE